MGRSRNDGRMPKKMTQSGKVLEKYHNGTTQPVKLLEKDQISSLFSATRNPSLANINALEEKRNNFRNLYIDFHRMPERSLPSKLRKKVIPDAEEKFADFAQNSKNTALKKVSVVQRRSKRFLKRPLPRQDEETKPVTENIEISESDRDSTSSCKKKKARMGEFSAEKDEDKTDYLILLLEENKKMIEQLNFEKSCLCFATQNPSFANFNALEEKKNNFRNLYIDCHKKLDLSIRENHLLSNKLEKALGRLETFQKGFTEGIAKIEQAIFVSSLTEKSETGKSRVGYAGEDDIKHPSSGGKKAARTGKKR